MIHSIVQSMVQSIVQSMVQSIVQSIVQSMVQSRVQSMVQSRVQDPGLYLTCYFKECGSCKTFCGWLVPKVYSSIMQLPLHGFFSSTAFIK